MTFLLIYSEATWGVVRRVGYALLSVICRGVLYYEVNSVVGICDEKISVGECCVNKFSLVSMIPVL
jgi:hypothetical protein